MCQPLCTRASARAHANAHAHARRSGNFHRLETLLAQRRFQLIPMEILPHCAAVPLGVMVRGIMESLLDAEALEKLLQEYAPQQYTLELTIDALVSLLIQVSAGHRATVFAAYTADQASMPPTISTSYQALYAKLGRMDPKLSEAIVRFCAEKLRLVLEKLPRAAEPILAGYRTQILDGNVLTGTDHRLTALRQWLNACLPGKSLVVLEPDLGLISDLVLCEDAYTQERALLTYILERVQARDLLVFDRNFTTTGFAFGIAERGGSFVGRQHRTNLPVQPVSKLVKCGETETGRIYEQIVRATDPDTGATLLLRRIEVRLFEKTARWREDNWALDQFTRDGLGGCHRRDLSEAMDNRDPISVADGLAALRGSRTGKAKGGLVRVRDVVGGQQCARGGTSVAPSGPR